MHHHILNLLLAVYLLAALIPDFGLNLPLTLKSLISKVLLMFLLFVAGLESSFSNIAHVITKPKLLILGIIYNFIYPAIFISIFYLFSRVFWHNQNETSNVLLGMVIIASMPIAGSAAGWTQINNGNTNLIIGLIMGTTILSPLTTSLQFQFYSVFLTGDFSEDLMEMAGDANLKYFFILSVMLPALLGVLVSNKMASTKRIHLKSNLKLMATLVLLLLNYLNASHALNMALSNPDWDFLVMIIATMFMMSFSGFLVGWFFPLSLKTKDSDRKALTFGLGMNNNGMGLVLASTSLPEHPTILLPIVFYNIGQQILASIFSRKFNTLPS